jgi:hypothetical protein
MKKLYTTLMIAMMAMMTMSLTSCETDEEIAYDLEGTWTGYMSIVDDYGEATTNSEITFIRYSNSYTEGNGLWADYYSDGYCSVMHFDWYVQYGTIYIRFEDGIRVEIRSYSLSSRRFRGRFWDGDSEVAFELMSTTRKYENSYNWGYTHYRSRGAAEVPASEVHPTHHRIK